ncbi:MAG: pilus assembly protein TadG-related protein [Actinomycetota bacterium]|nr:pilus assembly protein TadG-related protein [Actinomycetota bacterium]
MDDPTTAANHPRSAKAAAPSTIRVSRRRSERGYFDVFWALGMAIMVLFIGGMSTDLWHVTSQARTLDSAADSAAAAGASGLDVTTYKATGKAVLDPNSATQLAAANLANQTGLPGPPNPQIDVAPDNITVTLHGQVHITLLQLFLGRRTITLTSTANASPRAGPP